MSLLNNVTDKNGKKLSEKQSKVRTSNKQLTTIDKFTQEVKEKDKPPFPSVPTYDAKAWSVMRKYAKKGSLFWNVGR